jgi:D-sedoheptulose 7-phosphate isomerase
MNKAMFIQQIREKLEESARIKSSLAQNQTGEIERAVSLIIKSLKTGGKAVLFGNGGSAADAQHIAGELVGKLLLKRKALPAISLTTNTSTLTAIANDYGYENVFSRQVEALVKKGDIVIGLSTSGESPNVIDAMQLAKTIGAVTIGLTGRHAHGLADVADLVLTVPSDITPRIQEAHITIGHIICELVEQELAATG